MINFRFVLMVLGVMMSDLCFATGTLTSTPILGSSFVLGTYGSGTTTTGEVVTGRGSLKGAYTGTNSYNAFLRTSSSDLPLTQGQTYKISFSYKILSTPDRGFEVLFYSPNAGNAGSFLPSYVITGATGDTGTATLTNTLGAYSDYQAVWNIVGKGAIVIDDIQLTNVNTGLSITTENFEQTEDIYLFQKPRTDYMLNILSTGTDVVDKSDNTHTLVPYGLPMSFHGSKKYSKNTYYISHHVRAHAETYAGWDDIANLPVDFLRTGLNLNYGPNGESGRLYATSVSVSRFPDRSDKVIVGYVNSTEFGRNDLSFDPAWDLNNDRVIDSNITNLPEYVDTRVFNAPWKNYVAAYWTEAWRDNIKKHIDLAATQHFDGVMFDVMTGWTTWAQAYPNSDQTTLKQRYVDLVKWASSYAKSTYGSAFMITANLDVDLHNYFPDLGQYVDAGYYQNAFFSWNGSGEVIGYGPSTSSNRFSNAALDFIRTQGMALLDMDHLGTGAVSAGLDFTNYDNQITTDNLLKLFSWAIQSGSTPFTAPVFMGMAFSDRIPRFTRVLPELEPLTNTAYNDWVIGSNQDDVISTGDGDDLIFGGGGNDVIDGGSGTNTAYYVGSISNFRFTKSGNTLTVIDTTGSEGTDMLKSIRYLQFPEQKIDTANIPSNSQTDCFFNWVEDHYAAYFSPGRSASNTAANYYYRHYPATDSYLAIATNVHRLYYLGPLSSNNVIDLGGIMSWISTAGCQ